MAFILFSDLLLNTTYVAIVHMRWYTSDIDGDGD